MLDRERFSQNGRKTFLLVSRFTIVAEVSNTESQLNDFWFSDDDAAIIYILF